MSGSCALALILVALVLGTFSSAVFLWEWVVGAPTPLSALILLISITGVFLKVFLVLKRRIPRLQVASVRHWIFRLLPAACMLIGLVSSGIAVVRQAGEEPNGEWDALAVWNLHARFLYRGSAGAWRGIFDPRCLGATADILCCFPDWSTVPGRSSAANAPIIPALLAIGFGALSIGIVWSGVSALARDERGWLSGLLLLATPSFLVLVSGSNSRHPDRSIYADNRGASAVCRSLAGGQAADAGAGGSVRGLCSLDEKRRAFVCGCRPGEPSGDVRRYCVTGATFVLTLR